MSNFRTYNIICDTVNQQWANGLLSYLQIALRQFGDSEVQCTLGASSSAYNILVISDQAIANVNYKNLITDALKNTDIKKCLLFLNEVQLTYPPEILTYNFYDFNIELDSFQQYTPSATENNVQQFCAKVIDLAYNLLEQNKQANLGNKFAFVANTSADQYRVRDMICWELQKNGYQILSPLSINSVPNYENHVCELLKKCSLCIHIIGAISGNSHAETDLSVIELQTQISSQYISNNGSIKRIIYIAPNLNVSEIKHQNFILNLKTQERDAFTDILQAPVDELINLLGNTQSQINPIAPESINNNNYLYIIADRDDIVHVEPLLEFLQQKKVPNAYLLHKGSSSQIINTHKQHLINADNIIVLYNSGSKNWLRSKLNDILKAPGFGRVQNFKSVILVNMQPALPDNVKIPEICKVVNVLGWHADTFNSCYKNLELA